MRSVRCLEVLLRGSDQGFLEVMIVAGAVYGSPVVSQLHLTSRVSVTAQATYQGDVGFVRLCAIAKIRQKGVMSGLYDMGSLLRASKLYTLSADLRSGSWLQGQFTLLMQLRTRLLQLRSRELTDLRIS